MRALLAVALAAALLGAAPTTDLEERARAIEGKLMAPCCMSNTVATHESEVSRAMRQEIRQALALGRSEGEILDGFVDRYGEQVLALPRARGFNLAAYLLPFLLAALATGILVSALRRWRKHAGPAALPVAAAPPDPVYAERLAAALRRRDEPEPRFPLPPGSRSR